VAAHRLGIGLARALRTDLEQALSATPPGAL
jgi:hypothetical protein